MNKSNLNEYELIDGKPYGGNWYGSSFIIRDGLNEDFENDPIYNIAIHKLRECLPKSFEIRNERIIYRPPYYCSEFSPLRQNATLAIKALIWGRAFRVLKLKKTGKKSYKKVYVSGRRKKIRNL